MQDKRYQVFISSTFTDLRDERRAVQDVIISTGDFPVQMEDFPAADEDQFEFIKTLIDQCDYYVLIIAGRYGSIAQDGMSYTEKEYHYAVSKNVPVLVMLHDNRTGLALDKSEETQVGRKRLNDFIEEASKGRLRKTWDSTGDLKLTVREALENAKATKPRPGWVRGDSVASIEILEELNEVRKENDQYREAIGQYEVDIPLPKLPDHNDEVAIGLFPSRKETGGYGQGPVGTDRVATVKGTWLSLFPLFFSNLKWGTSDWNDEYFYHIIEDDSCAAIGSAIANSVSDVNATSEFCISKNDLEMLTDYFVETGFMKADNAGEPFSDIAKRFARRLRINRDGHDQITLEAGEISMDNEIPF